MVRAISHLENRTNFRGRNYLYLAGRLGQRIEVSAVTSCPYQRAHRLTELEIMPVGQKSVWKIIDGFIDTSLIGLRR